MSAGKRSGGKSTKNRLILHAKKVVGHLTFAESGWLVMATMVA